MKQSIEDRMRKENKNNFNIQSLEKGLLFGTKICKKTWTYEIVAVDEMFAKMLGIPASRKEEAIGIEMSDIIHPNDLARVVKETLWELQGSEKYDCKYRMKNADDEYHWVRDIGERFWIDGQEYIQGTVFDIDEKETLIRERDVTYESMPGGVVFVVIGKDNFYIREANQYSFDMLGVGREEYLGSSGKYTFPEDLPKLREHFVQQAKKREPLDYEFRIRLEENGKIVWYRIIGNYIDSREQGEEYLCIMMDITTRKTFQYELIKEKEKYERTLNTSADLLFEYNVRHKKFRILGQNYISDDTKLAIEDSLDEDYRKILFKKDIVFRGDRSKIKQFIRGQISCNDTVRLLTKNTETGKVYYDNYELFLNKIMVKEKTIRVIGYAKKVSYNAVPVTERQQLHEIFDEQIVKDYSFILKIDVPTEAFESYFIEKSDYGSYTGNRYYSSFLKWWCNTYVCEQDRKEIEFFLQLDEMLRILHSGEPKGYRFCRVETKESQRKHKICSFSFYGSDINTVLLVVRDVSQIREEEVYQKEASQKLLTDALAEARASVKGRQMLMKYLADEIENPVGKMKELLLEPENPELLPQLERCVEYMSEMIDGMKEYQLLQTQFGKSNEAFNLYALCMEVCEEERKISLGLDISIQEVIDLPIHQEYYMYGERFREILVNLLGNAVKYAPRGSAVKIYIQETNIETDRCVIRIRMEDEGPVINEKYFERMLDDQYDYNVNEKVVALGGNGFSASLVAKITELLGGTVEFRKGVLDSNVVEISLPVLYYNANPLFRDPEHKEEVIEEVNMCGQGYLLVENAEQRDPLTASLFQINGAVVYEASSGKMAMELLEKINSGQITAVLMDKDLDDMKCYELARQIRFHREKVYGKLPILLMLDGIEQEDTRLNMLSGINATIHKPINLSKLLWMIENLQGKGV